MYVITSDAPELSSARIQLELEDFQLGSARLVRFWAQLILQKIWHNELFVLFEDFEFSSCNIMDLFGEKTSDLVSFFHSITKIIRMSYKNPFRVQLVF